MIPFLLGNPYLIDQFDLSGRLQYFHVQSLARDFQREQQAAIRMIGVPENLHLPSEMSALATFLPSWVGMFGGTRDSGAQWMVTLERTPVTESGPTLLDSLFRRASGITGRGWYEAVVELSDADLRAIYAERTNGPMSGAIGFTSLLLGLQAEVFGYPLQRVVDNMNADCANMNADCAFPEVGHDCADSFFSDIGKAWQGKVQGLG